MLTLQLDQLLQSVARQFWDEFPSAAASARLREATKNTLSESKLSLESFGFSQEELKVLVSVIFYSVDIEADTSKSYSNIRRHFRSEDENAKEKERYRNEKIDWLRKWRDVTCQLLDIPTLISRGDLRERIKQLQSTPVKQSAILVEVATFEPYFQLAPGDTTGSQARFNEVDRNTYFSQCASWLNDLFGTDTVETEMGIKSSYRYFNDCAKKISKAVSGENWTWAWIGLGAVVLLITAPMLAGVVGGAMGLTGAAATSAGLAFLGGGSLAAGGLGMTGGYVALMAGGAILGYGAGNSEYKSRLKGSTKEELLVSCSKLYAASETLQGYWRKDLSKRVFLDKLGICSEALALQRDCEADADKAFTEYDKATGKELHNKAAVLAAFRRVVRGDL